MISLAMIAKNEATRISACLASVAQAVDEIVVVDTGSSDGTAALARAQGARVFEWPWRDDFAAARNQALALAEGPWILVLDADERLTAGQAALVRSLASEARADGFNCRLVSRLPADQPSPVIAHWYCRLFRKRDGVRYEGRIHEQIAPSIVAAGGQIAASEITILHDGYAEISAAKLTRNLGLLRQALTERPDDAFTLFNFGLTLASAGSFDEAADAFRRALESTTSPLAHHLRAVSWMKLAEARMQAGAWKAAGEAAERALALQPDLALARYALGRALFEQGALQAAGLVFDELTDGPADALGMTLHPRLVAIARALIRLRQRRCADAAEILEPVAGDDPTGESTFHLGNAYLALGRLADAAQAYRAARARGVNDAHLGRRLALCTRLAGADLAGVAPRSSR